MSVWTKLVRASLLAALLAPAWASDLAVLRNGFTIRHERRESLGQVTRLYLTADAKGSYVDVPSEQIDGFEPVEEAPPATPETTNNLPDVISSASGRYRLDPDFVHSVIAAESGFNPNALSSKGAQGLMQLMPQTASSLGVNNAFDPRANVDGGTRYLRELLERYNFDVAKALAAYNAGPHRVEQYGGVPPYRETRAYVARIIRDFNRKKMDQKKSQAPGLQGSPQTAATSPSKPAPPPASSGRAAGRAIIICLR